MINTVSLFYFLVFLLASNPLRATDKELKPNSPELALYSYHDAIKKNDIESVKSLIDSFSELPVEYKNNFAEKLKASSKLRSPDEKLVLKSSKLIADCAVVVFEDGKRDRPDYDPAYLIKKEGKWRVFMKLTKWKHPTIKLTADQVNRFKKLEKWYDDETVKLYQKHKDNKSQ